MFCKWCGAEVNNTDIYCPKCGGNLSDASSVNENNGKFEEQADKKRTKTRIIAGGALLMAAVIVLAFFVGGRGPRATVNQFFGAAYTADVEAIAELIPDPVVENAIENNGYDRDEMKEFFQDASEELQERIDAIASYYGEDWEVSFETAGEEDVEGEELEKIKMSYENLEVDVTAAKSVEVNLIFKNDGRESSVPVNIPVIKSGRSWYIDIMKLDNIF